MLELATIAFNRPRLIGEQIRLLRKHLTDEFTLTVLDNSDDEEASREIHEVALAVLDVHWERPSISPRMHHLALNHAARSFREQGSEFFGFLDHDIFPVRETRLLPLIEEAGFLGIGQRAPATGRLYPWPGWVFFSRDWLGERELNFGGKGGGDTGSALQDLFDEEEWEKFYRVGHGYRAVRHPDDVGLQSWGYEHFSTDGGEPDWIHLTNGSRWMAVPDIEGRERIIFDLLAEL